MWLLNQPSSAARTALAYITVGALTVIWTGVWAVYLYNNPPATQIVYYLCGGFLVTGFVLIGIGFGLGRIGRSARHADLPPQDVSAAEVNAPANVAAPVALVQTPKSTAAVVVPNTAVLPSVAPLKQTSGATLAQ
jgi:hypothetical protein